MQGERMTVCSSGKRAYAGKAVWLLGSMLGSEGSEIEKPRVTWDATQGDPEQSSL